jgi:hypothetical protein
MNERIIELAEQAKEYADTKYSKLVSASRWGDCVPGIRELYTEKLAELIVRECARVVDEKLDFENAYGPDDWAEGADLLNHFGVKE